MPSIASYSRLLRDLENPSIWFSGNLFSWKLQQMYLGIRDRFLQSSIFIKQILETCVIQTEIFNL